MMLSPTAEERPVEPPGRHDDGGEVEGRGEEGDPRGGVEEDLQDHGQDPAGTLLRQVLH